VGLDIDRMSTHLDLTTLETEGLPTRKTRVARGTDDLVKK
jgi:hypothetical protein